jgi:hypothetical protein
VIVVAAAAVAAVVVGRGSESSPVGALDVCVWASIHMGCVTWMLGQTPPGWEELAPGVIGQEQGSATGWMLGHTPPGKELAPGLLGEGQGPGVGWMLGQTPPGWKKLAPGLLGEGQGPEVGDGSTSQWPIIWLRVHCRAPP